jgi:hypothetical protein
MINAQLKQRVLEALGPLSSEEFQRRVWVQGIGPEVSDLSEAICQLFDDTGLSDLLEKDRPIFNPQLDDKFKALSRAIDCIDRSLGPAEMVAHPKMREIRTLSAGLIRELSAM